MKVTDIEIKSIRLNEGKFCYICECSLIGIENLKDFIFKFVTPCNIEENDKIEVNIPENLVMEDNISIDDIITNIERYWIEGRYLDCNGFSSRCAKIKQGRKYLTLVNRFPDIYVNNKDSNDIYYVIDMNIYKPNRIDSEIAIPIGFVRK